MLPLWFPFLVYRILLATANTFFYEQTNYTANYLGAISPFSIQQSDYSCNDPRLHLSHEIPATIFVIIRYSTSFLVSRLCNLCVKNSYYLAMLVRCGVGLAVSPICCVVAWRVEKYRVHQCMDNAMCIRFPWLIPQFVMLGLMEGLVFHGIQNIYVSLVPHSLSIYAPTFTEFALNIGHFVGFLFLLIFSNLFDDYDLDYSKSGVYYINLGFVCVANLVIYCCVATFYGKQESVEAMDFVEHTLEEMHSLQEGGPESVGVIGDQQVE